MLNDRVVDLRRTSKLRRQRAGDPAEVHEEHRPSRDAHELVALLSSSRLGLEFLLEAPLETVGVLFLAHPKVVEEARAIVASDTRTGGDDNNTAR